MDISEKLKKLRIDHGLSQKELAAKLNIAQASISDYERGIRPVQTTTLAAYARAFQIDMDELLPMDINTQNVISTLLYLDQLIPLIIECRPSGKTYMMFQAGILDEFLSEWKEMKSKRVHGLISEEQYDDSVIQTLNRPRKEIKCY